MTETVAQAVEQTSGAIRMVEARTDRQVITFDQLLTQLQRFEGQVIHNAAGMALVIAKGAQDQERAERERRCG